jgi:hypothetical protein
MQSLMFAAQISDFVVKTSHRRKNGTGSVNRAR